MKKIDLSELPPEILDEAREQAEAEGFMPVGAYRLKADELPFFLAHVQAGGDPDDFNPERINKLQAFAKTLPSAIRSAELAALRDKNPEDLAVRREIFTMAIAVMLHSPCIDQEVAGELDRLINMVFPEIVRGTVKGGGDSPMAKAFEAYQADTAVLSAYKASLDALQRKPGENLQ